MLYNNPTPENETIQKRLLKAPNYNDIHICDQCM